MSVETPHVQQKSQILKRLKIDSNKDDELSQFKLPDSTVFQRERQDNNDDRMDQDASDDPVESNEFSPPNKDSVMDSTSEDNNNHQTVLIPGNNPDKTEFGRKEEELLDKSSDTSAAVTSTGNNQIDKKADEEIVHSEDKDKPKDGLNNDCKDEVNLMREEMNKTPAEPETLGSSPSEGNEYDEPPPPSSPTNEYDRGNPNHLHQHLQVSLHDEETKSATSNQVIGLVSCGSPEEVDRSLSSSSASHHHNHQEKESEERDSTRSVLEGGDESNNNRYGIIQETNNLSSDEGTSNKEESGPINLRQNYRPPSQNNNSGGNLNSSSGNHIIKQGKIGGGSTSPENLPTINLSALQQRQTHGVIHYSHNLMGPNQDKRKKVRIIIASKLHTFIFLCVSI